jgi:hypothetical protein
MTLRLQPSLATRCEVTANDLIDQLYLRVLEAFRVLFVGVTVIVVLSRLFVAYLRRRAERAKS